MIELTVQLVPDLSSIALLEPDACRCHTAFEGQQPPGHHHSTALHSYLECICPSVGASFADVGLDTAHITFATLRLPLDKLQMFTAAFTEAAAQLPSLSSESYAITGLALQKKPGRHEKHIKGDSFYYLDLESASINFVTIQRLWLEALRKTAHKCSGWCIDEKSMQRQHMTIRSFSLRTAAGSFDQVARAVQLHPATIQCAGIRIQQSVDDAMDSQTGMGMIAHGYLHSLLVRYPVPLYSSCVAASQIIRLADSQRRMQRLARKSAEAVIEGMQDMQLMSEGKLVSS